MHQIIEKVENRTMRDSVQSKRLIAPLMGRIEAIKLINDPAMRDRIYKHVYGKKIVRDDRRPLMWAVAFQAKYRSHPQAEKLNALVMKANDRTRPVARDTIRRAVDLGLISEEREGRNTYYFL